MIVDALAPCLATTLAAMALAIIIRSLASIGIVFSFLHSTNTGEWASKSISPHIYPWYPAERALPVMLTHGR